MCLLVGAMLGIEHVMHMNQLERDPLVTLKLGLKKLPHISTDYRALERFQSEDDLKQLERVHRELLEPVLRPIKIGILDIDTTVEPVQGKQEGTSVGYNPRYRGRRSFQPFIAFDGQNPLCNLSTIAFG